MLTQLFNCRGCKKPFSTCDGHPQRPVLKDGETTCASCSPDGHEPALGLIEFLKQAAFRPTENGFFWSTKIAIPKCARCPRLICAIDGWCVTIGTCGHYICKGTTTHCSMAYTVSFLGCNGKRLATGQWKCWRCQRGYNDPHPRPVDAAVTEFLNDYSSTLAKLPGNFWDLVATSKDQYERVEFRLKVSERHVEVLRRRVEELTGESERTKMTECSNCSVARPIERLYQCRKCETTVCADCLLEEHAGHEYDNVLKLRLPEWKADTSARQANIIGGYQSNLCHLHTNISTEMLGVLEAGSALVDEMDKCQTHAQADAVAATIDRAIQKVETQCEIYIPVARNLATELRDIREDLLKKQLLP
ncbi:unnamed protein product, partial [Mesorhabditis spiculigera]